MAINLSGIGLSTLAEIPDKIKQFLIMQDAHDLPKELILRNNKLTHMRGLEHVKYIDRIDLCGNTIRSFEGMPRVKHLTIEGNRCNLEDPIIDAEILCIKAGLAKPAPLAHYQIMNTRINKLVFVFHDDFISHRTRLQDRLNEAMAQHDRDIAFIEFCHWLAEQDEHHDYFSRLLTP
jgi:hypothetical protein